MIRKSFSFLFLFVCCYAHAQPSLQDWLQYYEISEELMNCQQAQIESLKGEVELRKMQQETYEKEFDIIQESLQNYQNECQSLTMELQDLNAKSLSQESEFESLMNEYNKVLRTQRVLIKVSIVCGISTITALSILFIRR